MIGPGFGAAIAWELAKPVVIAAAIFAALMFSGGVLVGWLLS